MIRIRSIAFKLLHRYTKTIASLLEWIESNLGCTEGIDIYEWMGDPWFYVVVRDVRVGWRYPEGVRLGFTVDIENDMVMWSNEPYPINGSGGNCCGDCFVRTNRWKGLLRKKYGAGIEKKFYWYGSTYLEEAE